MYRQIATQPYHCCEARTTLGETFFCNSASAAAWVILPGSQLRKEAEADEKKNNNTNKLISYWSKLRFNDSDDMIEEQLN